MSICSWSFGTKFDKQYLTASLIVAQFYLSPSFVLQLFHKLLLHPTILSEIMEVKKTAWLKRKLIWPLKSNLLRSMPRWAVFSVILSRCFLWPLVLVATWLMLDLMRTAWSAGWQWLAATGEISYEYAKNTWILLIWTYGVPASW